MTTEEKHIRLRELADGAIARLKQLSAPVVRVSGPLTSGGYGYDENLRHFIAAQNKLRDQNYTVFDYVKDDTTIQTLGLAWAISLKSTIGQF